MDKGIRPAANAKFAELLPTRAEVGNTAFRKNVMFYLMEEFGCTNPAAATHYNHAFQQVKAANPELVVGLGRPEGKNNGGRKKKVVIEGVVADSAPQGETAAPAGDAALATDPEAQYQLAQLGATAEVAEITAALTAPAATDAEVAAATDIVNLYKAKDKSLVQLGIPRAEAEALIAKAAKAKKAALVIA